MAAATTMVHVRVDENIKAQATESPDHTLSGDWAGHRECRVGGDFRPIYTVDDSGKSGLMVFVRSGTHSELFA